MSTQGHFERVEVLGLMGSCWWVFNPMETKEERLCYRDNSEIPEENYSSAFFVSVRVYKTNL